jgi:hypothetical protein
VTLKQQTLFLAFVLGFVGSMIFGQVQQAYPHDWYTGIRNPATGEGCCGGRDCFPLMTDELHRLTEDKDNYIIDGMWKFPKKDAMPAKHSHNPDESGYSYCIWGGKARCFFFPSFS